jgi:DNA-binding response OmpR family regulator
LPGMDGLSILRELRGGEDQVAVLILTAKDTVADRVGGLDLGADDYLVKPFAFEELLARVRALVRRRYEARSPIVRVADLEIDTTSRRARRGGETIDLTAREYAMLELLALRAGEVVTRTEIWDHIYDFNAEPNSNVIDVYIGHLRKRLARDGLPGLIHTRRGLGYVLGEAP